MLYPVAHQEVIEAVHIGLHRLLSFQVQHLHLLHHPFPQGVHLRQGSLSRIVPFPGPLFLQALHLPGLAGEEAAVGAVSFDACLQAVVLQPVRLLPCQVRQTAAQVMEDRLVGEILPIQLQSAFDVFYHGVQGDLPGAVDVAGDVHLGKFRLYIRGVSRQVPQDDGNVPKGKPLLPDQAADFQAGLAHFLFRIRGLKESNLPPVLPFTGALAEAEQMLFQMPQGRGLPEAVECIVPDKAARLP